MNTSRRQFLAHAGALGLGMLFFASQHTVVRAEEAHRIASPVESFEGLVFETIESGGLAHYSYFLGDKSSGEAVVIDPRRDVAVYLDLAKKHGLEIVSTVDTHIHADFLSGARELKERTGKTNVAVSIEGEARYGFTPERGLRHGEVMEFGRFALKALHTPGHTPEHLSFVAYEKSSPDKPWALFTGDFLFVGSVGRPDLMGVENTERLSKALYETVRNGYRGLPDALAIYPAHGPGSPCGAGIKRSVGQPTLGNERSSNPYWHLKTEKSFVGTLLQAQPPVPYYWPRMKKLNATGVETLGRIPKVTEFDSRAFGELSQRESVQLLDTRSAFSHASAHIPGSLNIGYDQVVSLWGGWILHPDKPIVMVVPEEGSSSDLMDWLSRVGLERNVMGELKGGMAAWVDSGLPFDSYPLLSVQRVREIFPTSEMQLLDVRQPAEWDMGHLPHARYIFLPELAQRHTVLDRSKPVLVYCGTGYRASIGASILRGLGYDARMIPGSYGAWVKAGYPVVIPKEKRPASDTTRG